MNRGTDGMATKINFGSPTERERIDLHIQIVCPSTMVCRSPLSNPSQLTERLPSDQPEKRNLRTCFHLVPWCVINHFIPVAELYAFNLTTVTILLNPLAPGGA